MQYMEANIEETRGIEQGSPVLSVRPGRQVLTPQWSGAVDSWSS